MSHSTHMLEFYRGSTLRSMSATVSGAAFLASVISVQKLACSNSLTSGRQSDLTLRLVSREQPRPSEIAVLWLTIPKLATLEHALWREAGSNNRHTFDSLATVHQNLTTGIKDGTSLLFLLSWTKPVDRIRAASDDLMIKLWPQAYVNGGNTVSGPS